MQVEPTTMEEAVEAATRKEERAQAKASELLPIEFPDPVNRHDTAVIWVTFFSRRQRHRCWQGKLSADKKGFLSTKAAVIKVDDLNFTYRGGEAPVIQDVEFRMTLQSRCALLGKNGAGKTTVRPPLRSLSTTSDVSLPPLIQSVAFG